MATNMVTDITMNIDHLQLAQLLQLTSPSLPIGGFAWSQGTESAIDQGWLKGEDDFGDWLQGILHTGPVPVCTGARTVCTGLATLLRCPDSLHRPG